MKHLFQAVAVAALVALSACDRKVVEPDSPMAMAAAQEQTQQTCGGGGPGAYRSFVIYNGCPAGPVNVLTAQWAISNFPAPGAYQAADHCRVELRQGSTVYVLADPNASIIAPGGTRTVYWQVPAYIPTGTYMFRVAALPGESLTNYTTADSYLEAPVEIVNTAPATATEGVYFDVNVNTGAGTVYWDPADFGGSGYVRIAVKPRYAQTYLTFEGQHTNVGYTFPNTGTASVNLNSLGLFRSIIGDQYDVIVDKPNAGQALKTLLPFTY